MRKLEKGALGKNGLQQARKGKQALPAENKEVSSQRATSWNHQDWEPLNVVLLRGMCMDVWNLSQVPRSPPGHLPNWWWDLCALAYFSKRDVTTFLRRQYYLKHLAESLRRRMTVCFLSSHRRRFSSSVTSIISIPRLEQLSPNCFRWSIEAVDDLLMELLMSFSISSQELWILHCTGC